MNRLRSISIPTLLQNPNSFNLLRSQSQTIHNLIQTPDPPLPNRQPWNRSSFARESTSTDTPGSIVDELVGLTLLEITDLTEILRKKQGIEEMPVMTMMMPGMGFSARGVAAKGGGAKTDEKLAEKTAFDLKLEAFEAAAKIKIIKEVRTFTDLGLKEAKDLVEKAPTLLKKGVTKEEGQKIIDKLKELGAKVVME